MFALYCTDRLQRDRIRAAFPAGSGVVEMDDWRQFERIVTQADCGVVELAWLRHDPRFPGLVLLKSRLPFVPVVLITRRDADNALQLKDVPVEVVVWTDDVVRTLCAALTAACNSSVLNQFACRLETSDRLVPGLRSVLARACRAPTPVGSVSALASLAGCDRRTLWRRWRRSFSPDAPVRLEDFLHWLLLLRAVRRKAPGVGWLDVAAELGVHQHTLGRLARRLGGISLRDLSTDGWGILIARFGTQVIGPLLGGKDWDKEG